MPPTEQEALSLIIPMLIQLRFRLCAQVLGGQRISPGPLSEMLMAEPLMQMADDIHCVLCEWLPYMDSYMGAVGGQPWMVMFRQLKQQKSSKEINNLLESCLDKRKRTMLRMGVCMYHLAAIQEAIQDGTPVHKAITKTMFKQIEEAITGCLNTWATTPDLFFSDEGGPVEPQPSEDKHVMREE